MLESLTVPSPTPIRRRPARRVSPEAAERRRLEADLRQAVRLGAFMMNYQPRYVLRDGRMVGAEALIRWPHARRGLVSPAAFIPLAEQTGLITQIGGFALRRACAVARDWPGMVVSVNVSARQVSEQALLRQVAVALEESGLPAERLELELTESMLLHVDQDTLLVLSALRDRGVGLALDDFGTGYASLGMLRRLPLSAMKLDRTLIRDLPDDREDVAIVRAAVQTGHAMGLTVVAEGIETEAQREFLAAIGCDEGQGYLFARPAPAGQVLDLAGAAER
jgi:EAL domain-containing protein (putative c-di-GMP-specific phosphodiesterase class I)